MYGMVIKGYSFNLKNFQLIKYIFTYLGAITIGSNLPVKKIFNNKIAAICLFLLFIMSLTAIILPDIGTFLSNVYGQKSYMDAGLRLTFIDVNPNMTAQFGIILAMMSIISSSWLVNALSLVMVGMITILTASRGNMITLGVFILFYYFHQLKSSKRLLFLFFSLFLIITVGNNFLFNFFGRQRISRIQRIEHGFLQRWNFAYKLAFEEDFLDSPLMGKGYRTRFGRGGERFKYTGVSAMEAHSQWIGFLANHGVVGFIILCGFSYAIGRRLWKTHKKLSLSEINPELREIGKYLLAIYISYFTSMIGWETLYIPVYSSFFFIFFGMIYRLSEEKVSYRTQ